MVGDSNADILSLHKTLCDFRVSSRAVERDGMVSVEARLLDANLQLTQTHAWLSSEFAKGNPRGVHEVIVVKRFRVGGQQYSPQISLHPFESSDVFQETTFGVLPTALSICLRKAYMSSMG